MPGKKTVMGGHDLKVYEDWLEKVHTYFREAFESGANANPRLRMGAGQLLHHPASYSCKSMKIYPAGYYKQLPKLAVGSLKGLPRIYAIGQSRAFLPKLFIECDRPANHPDPGSGTCTTDDGRIMGFTDFPAL